MELARQEMDQYWLAYKKNNCEQAREKLILKYYSLVKYVAARVKIMLPEQWDYEDLVGYGILGLLEAVERFDPEKGVRFETYAISRIKGRIIDEIRAVQFIPRSVQNRVKRLVQAQEELEGRLKRNPTDRELAEELGMGLDEYYEFLKEASYPALLSLDFSPGESTDEGNLLEIIPGEENVEEELGKKETIRVLGKAIEGLPEKERLVLTLYYYEGLTLKEISEVMDLSPARISQLHTKAIFRLRGKLGRKKNLLLGT